MIMINMNITQSMDKFSRLITGDLGDNHRQSGVTGNIKCHPKESITTPLVKQARKFIAGDIKVKKDVAERERESFPGFSHSVKKLRIPSRQDRMFPVRKIF